MSQTEEQLLVEINFLENEILNYSRRKLELQNAYLASKGWDIFHGEDDLIGVWWSYTKNGDPSTVTCDADHAMEIEEEMSSE